MKKLENFDFGQMQIEENQTANVLGGTSTTSYKEACLVQENEYPEGEDGCPDYTKKPVLVDLPI